MSAIEELRATRDDLAARFQAAIEERDRAEQEHEAAKVCLDDTLADLASELGRGAIDADEYESRKAQAVAAVEQAEQARERTAAVAATLEPQAHEAARAVLAAQEEQAYAPVSDDDAAIARLEAALRARRAKRAVHVEQAKDAYRDAEREAAEFDPKTERAIAAREQHLRERVRLALHFPPMIAPEVVRADPELRAAVEAEKERRRQEQEAAQGQLRELAIRSWQGIGVERQSAQELVEHHAWQQEVARQQDLADDGDERQR